MIKKQSKSLTVDRIVNQAISGSGHLGKFHLYFLSCLAISGYCSLSFHSLVMVFTAWTPDHVCKNNDINGTDHIISNRSVFYDEKCQTFNKTSNLTEQCKDGWVYKNNKFQTITMEWNLVCDLDYMADLNQTIFFAGCCIGVLLYVLISDKYGRKKLFLIGYTVHLILSFSVTFAPNFLVYTFLRFFLGIAVYLQIACAEILIIESFASNQRTFAGIGLEFGWTFGYNFLGLLGYYITSWKTFQLSITFICLFFFIFTWPIPESVPWLVSKKKYEEADDILKKLAIWNGKSKEDVTFLIDIIENQAKGVTARKSSNSIVPNNEDLLISGESILLRGRKSIISPQYPPEIETKSSDIFTVPVLRKHLLITLLQWFTNVLVFYTIILSMPSLAGDRFVSYFISGVIEIPAFISCYFMTKYSRRKTTFVSFICAGLAILPLGFIPKTTDKVNLEWLIITLAALGKFSILISFACVLLWAREVFPTSVRATGSGISTFVARIAGTLAPQLSYVMKKDPWIPGIIMACLSVFAGISALFLPETAGKPLPNSIADTINLYYDDDDQNELAEVYDGEDDSEEEEEIKAVI